MQFSKTCIACGDSKPLAAFLQISGAQGTLYGNVCATCRAANAKITLTPQEDSDDQGSGSSGLAVNAKTKVKTAQDERQKAKDLKDQDRKEVQKKYEKFDEKVKREAEKTDAEQDQRKNYLEKQGLLSQNKKKLPTTAATSIQVQNTQNQQTIDAVMTVERAREKQEGEIIAGQKETTETQEIDTIRFGNMDRNTALGKFQARGYLELNQRLGINTGKVPGSKSDLKSQEKATPSTESAQQAKVEGALSKATNLETKKNFEAWLSGSPYAKAGAQIFGQESKPAILASPQEPLIETPQSTYKR